MNFEAIKEAIRAENQWEALYNAELNHNFGEKGVAHNGFAKPPCRCPLHSEKKASFSVNLSTGIFSCQGCKETGDFFTFIQLKNGLSYPDTLKYTAEKLGLNIENLKPLTEEQKAELVERERNRQEQAKKQKQDSIFKVQQEAQSFIATCTPLNGTGHAYLKKKGIESCESVLCFKNDLVLPYTDIDGVVCNLQKILPKKITLKDGRETDKLFLPGNLKPGLFFTIPGNQDFGYAEGFATGRSVSMATNETVLVCGTAHNVIEVIKANLKKNPDSKHTFYADDEWWKPAKENTGRKTGQKAAKLGINVRYPEFKDDSKQLKDFNDFHVEYGIDELRKFLQKPEKPQSMSDIVNYLYQNEDGDAALYVKLFKGKICFDHASNEWYQWKDNFWEIDKVGNYLSQTAAVVELYKNELPNQKEKPVITEDLKKRINALQTLKRKKSVLELARSGKNSLGISGDEWDSDGMILACKNAVIDLKTGQARPGKPSDYIRKHCNANWQGLNHVSELWEKFHSDVIGDSDTIEFNQRLLGYGITGGTQYHILPIYWGTGRNGKGTLVETIAHVMGQYAMKTRSESLIDDPKGMKQSHDADKVSLKGRRLVWASETEDGCKLSTARVKELVGGDTLSARSPYGKRPVDFVPTHKLFLLTNHLPHIQPNDLAIWERVRKIEFNKNFLDNNPDTDHDLPEKLKGEADGILSWLVRGCLKFQTDGLHAPESVLAATKKYRKKEDLIEQFLEECCIRKPDVLIKSGNLHAAYKAWCEADGTKATNNKKFKDELVLKGFVSSHDGRNSWIKGVQLLQKDDDDLKNLL